VASKSTNKTLVTLAVVAILLFAAWKLIPAFVSKIGSSGSASGTAGGGGVGYGGSDGYGSDQYDQQPQSLLGGLLSGLSSLFNSSGGGSGGGKASNLLGNNNGSNGSLFGSGSNASFGSNLYDYGTGTEYNPEFGGTLGSYDDLGYDSGLDGYQIPEEPIENLPLQGSPIDDGYTSAPSDTGGFAEVQDYYGDNNFDLSGGGDNADDA
jgi:hypothetical protein